MLRRNLIANFLGQGFIALVGLAFVPLYIRFLGMEAYGIVGIYAILQASLVLLDAGMRPTLTREMARFTAGAHDVHYIRDVLRTLELLATVIALLTSVGIAAASPFAFHWVNVETLPYEEVSASVALMGVVVGLRFVEGVYTSSLIGLQHQLRLNLLTSFFAAVRAIGAVALLALVSPTLHAFFLWQCLVSAASVAVLGYATHAFLPSATRRARFSVSVLNDVRKFATGMFAITLLAVLLTQVDKILLSTLLPLTQYAHYSLAAVIAGALYLFVYPINQAFLPRFNQLKEGARHPDLVAAYHLCAQLVSVFMGNAALLLIFFSGLLLRLWTRDEALAQEAAPLLSLLALGNMLNALITVPYQMQLAHGWTSLAVRTNTCSVAFIIPAVIFAATRFGAQGAACVWVLHNLGQFLVFGYLTFSKVLQHERRHWYLRDVAAPIGSSLVVACVFRWWIPLPVQELAQLAYLVSCFTLGVGAAALASTQVRSLVRSGLRRLSTVT